MDRELKLTLNSRRFEIIAKYICIFLKKIFIKEQKERQINERYFIYKILNYFT